MSILFPLCWGNGLDWILVFCVTCNDISVIYVTAHRFAGGPNTLWSGSQRHRHFVGFFNVPVQAPTRGHPFYGYAEKPPHLVAVGERGGVVLVIHKNLFLF